MSDELNRELPTDFFDRLNESAQLLRQNRPGEAIEHLLELHGLAPDNADVAINLSGAYILQAKWNRAVSLLKKAVAHHPTNAMLWTNLGAAELGRLEFSGPVQQDKAIAAYQRALRVDPHAPNVHYHLGLIYKERGELNRAGAFFQRALEVNGGDQDAQYWLDRIGRQLAKEQRNRAQTATDADSDAENGNADANADSDADSSLSAGAENS
ncbi:MAG: tetratricopeptide repeat protein [Litorilinea sp.]